MIEFDYIVVGAGSAGCVIASRLSEDEDKTVLLLEAGSSDRSIFVRMPTALSIPMNMPRFNWGYESQPEPGLDGRRMDCPRGKALGGRTSAGLRAMAGTGSRRLGLGGLPALFSEIGVVDERRRRVSR